MSRTPQEVFADHGNRLSTGDLDLISRNYTEDAVFLTPEGTLTGRETGHRRPARRSAGRRLAVDPAVRR
ncbi:hypothetical protein [Streptomyces sp. MNU89]|uniref:hypothetical protein n=1 Tax=Streptomyces sp. MNU89 TaxID=2560025 RepID=UPI001E28C506|nr:hypothetical protein [Streptomyces sp. MNU89]MCC9737656.1 hypothetical protein [Streptomyces sp. MNU89]